jgi:5-methylcytosine-specific restriction endonuclease McrA
LSWSKIDDRLPMSAKIQGLADPEARGDRYKAQRNEAVGHWLMILAWVSGERTDGFVPARTVEEYGRPVTTGRLLTARFDRAPLLHRRGENCLCLEGRRWPPDYEYAIHDYLDRNPSRAENDVARAQRKELRDRALREAVRRRDGDRCRYCGVEVSWADHKSARGGVLDHVVPDVAAGAENLVVSCRGCNARKGKRRPEAAGMRLLPLPRTGQDPRQDSQDPRRIHDGSMDRSGIGSGSDHGSVPEPVTDPAMDRAPPDDGPQPDPSGATSTPLSPAALLGPIWHTVTDHIPSEVTDAPGRDGTGPRYVVGPPDTPRGPTYPNPYLRSALTGPAPEEHAGLPPPEGGDPWT